MRTLLTVAALLAASPAYAAWTTTDTTLELAGAVLHVIDWSQTVNIAHSRPEPVTYQVGPRLWATWERPAAMAEGNPLLGRHPSPELVTGYFAATLAAHAAIAWMLPQPYRRVWQAAWIGLEGYCVATNFAGGVRLDFP